VWFGWQADVLPSLNRLTLDAPVARNPDGSPITGTVRTELTTLAPITTLNLSSGWFTVLNHRSYPTVSTDNRTALTDGFLPTLTVRAREQDPRRPIANTEWSFGSCPNAGAATPRDTQICIFASTQHGAALVPLATTPPFGNCQQQPNPNPNLWTMRALLADFTAWVRDDAAPPPSAIPRIADGTL